MVDWDELREIDREVAERIFGLATKWVERRRRNGVSRLWVTDGRSHWICPEYSWDLNSAKTVLDEMVKRGYGVQITNVVLPDERPGWRVQFCKGQDVWVSVWVSAQTSLSLAICEAALKAVRS